MRIQVHHRHVSEAPVLRMRRKMDRRIGGCTRLPALRSGGVGRWDLRPGCREDGPWSSGGSPSRPRSSSASGADMYGHRMPTGDPGCVPAAAPRYGMSRWQRTRSAPHAAMHGAGPISASRAPHAERGPERRASCIAANATTNGWPVATVIRRGARHADPSNGPSPAPTRSPATGAGPSGGIAPSIRPGAPPAVRANGTSRRTGCNAGDADTAGSPAAAGPPPM